MVEYVMIATCYKCLNPCKISLTKRCKLPKYCPFDANYADWQEEKIEKEDAGLFKLFGDA